MNDKKLYKNYIYNSAYQLLIIVVPLVLSPYVTRVLGPVGIGQYSYTRSVVTYFVLFGTVGTTLYGQREIAYVNGNKERRSNAFWEIFWIRFVLLMFSLLFYGYLEILNGRYPLLFMIQALDIVAAVVDITWYFQGTEEFGKITFRNACMKIFSAAFILCLVKKKEDLWLYVLLYSAGNLLGQLWLWKDVISQITGPRWKQLDFRRHIKGIILLFIPQIAIQIYLVIDKTMIEVITNDSAQTGYYELAQMVQSTGLTLTTAFGTVAASRVASLKEQGNTENIRQLILKSFEIICFIGFPIAFGFIAVAPVFVPWFFGEEYMPVVSLLSWMSPLVIIVGYSNVSGIQYLVPVGRQNHVTISTFAGAVINVCINALLIPHFQAAGAVWASLVSENAVLLIQLILIRNVLKWKEIVTGFCKAFLSAGIMLFAVRLSAKYFYQDSLTVQVVVLILEGVFVYIAMQTVLKNYFLIELKNKIMIRGRKR